MKLFGHQFGKQAVLIRVNDLGKVAFFEGTMPEESATINGQPMGDVPLCDIDNLTAVTKSPFHRALVGAVEQAIEDAGKRK